MRPRTTLLATFLIVGGISLILVPLALAAKKYVPVGVFPPSYPENQSWKPTYFSQLLAESAAVSDKNHHIYVADSGRGVVFDYKSPTDKEPARWNGSNTPLETFGGEHLSVAVDNSSGDVYVANRENHVIDKFTEDGELITTFGDSKPSPNGQLEGLETPAESFSPPTNYYASFPIAVDQVTHDLYVVDPGHRVIDVFDETGKYLRQITATPPGLYAEGGAYTTGIAVNATTGNVYVADFGGPEVFEFNSSGSYVSKWNGGQLPNGASSQTPDGAFGTYSDGSPISVATEDSTGNVFVQTYGFADVDVFDASGNYIPPQATNAELGEYWLRGAEGIAVDQETHQLYVSDNNTSSVQIFKAVIVPTASAQPAASLKVRSAVLAGHVDPASGEGGGPITSCRFEYISNLTYQENTRNNGAADPWGGASRAPCETNPPSSLPFDAATDVHASIGGLSSGTEYHFRLVVSNAEGTEKAVGPTFTTAGQYSFSRVIGSAGEGDGELSNPKDIAIYNSSGDFYVADTGNHRVDKFDSSGHFLAAWGWGVSNGSAEAQECSSGCRAGLAGSGAGEFESPAYIEVDNSEGPSAGDVYVADTALGRIQKFTSAGALVESWGENGSIELTGGEIGGLTVDTHGNLFGVTDNEPYYWTEIGQDGIFRRRMETGGFAGLGSPNGGGIEVDPIGGFYETQGGERGGVRFINPQAYFAYESGHDVYPPGYGNLINSGLALDRETYDIFVDQGTHIDRFTALEKPTKEECATGCPPQDTFGFGDLKGASGLAFDPSTAALYAANTGEDDIAMFTPVPTPTATTEPPESSKPTSAILAGRVSVPAGAEVRECKFEYADESAFSDNVQTVTLSAATGTGDETAGSTELTDVTASAGSFEVGEMIEGPGIPERTEIIGAAAGTLEITNPAETTASAVALTTKPTEGYFTLSYGEETTMHIPYNANFEAVKYYLESLGLIGEQNVTVSGSPGGPYRVAFKGALADRADIPQLTGDASGLGPSGSAVSVATVAGGSGWSSASAVPCSPTAPFSNSANVTAEVSGLTPFKTYSYKLVVVGSSELTSEGGRQTVTPVQGSAPTIDSSSGSAESPTAATLHAQINPKLASTIYRFEYGLTSSYGSLTPTSESIGEDSSDHAAQVALSDLQPGTTYHFRVIAINLNGMAVGPDQVFDTPALPSIADPRVSEVTQNSATLSAALRAGFRSTSYEFQYGGSKDYGSVRGGSIEADNSVHIVDVKLSGLEPGITYHFRVIATNDIGSTDTSDQVFTTAPAAAKEPEEEVVKKCKRGFVRRDGKCVRKPHHHHHRKRGHRHG